MPHYSLKCLHSNALLEDVSNDAGEFLLHSPHHPKALLRSVYNTPLNIGSFADKGLLAYSWLPKQHEFACNSYPVTFKSEALGRRMGLHNLYCTYSGYNPEIGAYNTTCTFKEFEAIGVFARQGYDHKNILVLASAGNTAHSFCEIGSKLGASALIVLPRARVKSLWTTVPKANSIRVLAVEGGYNDAIAIAQKIAQHDGFISEGGARNVGRRDALATTFLSAVLAMRRVPDHYVQAIGSGSGAISAWESVMRLAEFGVSENGAIWTPPLPAGGLPTIHIAQNTPFTPAIDSWEAKSEAFIPVPQSEVPQRLADIYAHVLANNNPPYAVPGGLYDMLSQCGGHGYACTNAEGHDAGEIFARLEGFPLAPSSEIALAALMNAVKNNTIQPDDYVMLNLTGGTDAAAKSDFTCHDVSYDALVPAGIEHADIDGLMSVVDKLF